MLGDRLALATFRKLRKILASTKDLARARNDDRADRRIRLGIVHDVLHRARRFAIQSVSNIWSVDAHDQKAIVAKVRNDRICSVVICHVIPPYSKGSPFCLTAR